MKTYQFKFTVCPAEKGFWVNIRNNIIEVAADTVGEATEKFVKVLEDKHGVTISKTAQKRPEKMYRDRKDGGAEEVGRVYTGSMEIDYGDGCCHADWRRKWVQVWTEVFVTQNVYLEAA